eukprot:8403137-Pyramimonas_sp.AAC.1
MTVFVDRFDQTTETRILVESRLLQRGPEAGASSWPAGKVKVLVSHLAAFTTARVVYPGRGGRKCLSVCLPHSSSMFTSLHKHALGLGSCSRSHPEG